ncbi:methylmalonyl-CoA mutase family protein [Solicola gregarius]|uniref:methylmalonyl-CoA mutase n=1 Tax=Solicola gregarius TaxID=2908642 RepID=A0AA46YNV2_9ACTN|nr:methylmalonyl-CoA mutase family protein [Solicola gregarius]UYM07018.1 methylmalonyl-CoA mutase family protein [Solicola gregarius]
MNPQPAPEHSAAYASWQRAVAGVLAKQRKVEPEDLGTDPERLLDAETYDGATVAPLYTPADELAAPPLPGYAPFTRGARAGAGGWGVCAHYGEHGGAVATNRLILDDLRNGVTSVWLTIDPNGRRGVAPDEVAATLEGVLFDLAPVRLDAGSAFEEAAEALLGVADSADVEDRSEVRLTLGADPWTLQIRNGSPVEGAGLDEAVALAVRLAARPERIRTLVVDGTVFHDAGASDAEELGASLAAGVAYVRALADAGLDVEHALAAIEFRHAITDEQFAGIAKLRAFRRAWARVADVLGAPDAGAAAQHAVTSNAMMAQRDPWVNMLRTTLAAFAAGVGGAGEVTVLPFDHALPGNAPGVSERFAARIARNTQLLLLEESHVGKVADPAGGSWYVEQLTDALARQAWGVFQEIERDGGFGAALDAGVIAELVATTRTARADDIAHRRTSVTGVNEFPNLAEPPVEAAPAADGGLLPSVRYAEPFEDMRDRSDRHLADAGVRPSVFLATLGPVAEHNQRATYAKNLLASAGVDVVESGPVDDGDSLAQAAREARLQVAVLCGSDGRYDSMGSESVAALRSGHAARVYAVGSAGRFTSTEGAPDDYLTPGIDVVAAMTHLLDLLEVAR